MKRAGECPRCGGNGHYMWEDCYSMDHRVVCDCRTVSNLNRKSDEDYREKLMALHLETMAKWTKKELLEWAAKTMTKEQLARLLVRYYLPKKAETK